MSEVYKYTPKEELQLHLNKDLFRAAASVLGYLISCDALGIPRDKFPKGWDENTQNIIDYFPKVRREVDNESLYENLQSRNPNKLEMLTTILKSREQNLEYIDKAKPPRRNFACYAIMTFCLLSTLRRVTYDGLGLSKCGFSYSVDASVWLEDMNQKDVLRILLDIQNTTEKMIKDPRGTKFEKEF